MQYERWPGSEPPYGLSAPMYNAPRKSTKDASCLSYANVPSLLCKATKAALKHELTSSIASDVPNSRTFSQYLSLVLFVFADRRPALCKVPLEASHFEWKLNPAG